MTEFWCYHNSVGNRRFRISIDNNLEAYTKAKTKHERSTVVTTVVGAIMGCRLDGRGGFIKKDAGSGRWFEVGDKTCREKVSLLEC